MAGSKGSLQESISSFRQDQCFSHLYVWVGVLSKAQENDSIRESEVIHQGFDPALHFPFSEQ